VSYVPKWRVRYASWGANTPGCKCWRWLEAFKAQASALERGVHVVVGTPGRVVDHLQRGTMNTQAVATVVLDEADRMLDMGFQAETEAILSALPKPNERQTVFFSATFPRAIEALSLTHQRNPVRVVLDDPEQVMPEIRQIAITAAPEQKLQALYWALTKYPHESVLVFCNFKATVAELEGTLAALGVSVDYLHGDLEQFDRDQVLARFRNQSVRILIASDVAGRGIDVEDLDIVVNYELPPKPEIYLHRIGRTGRAGKVGLAVSLATPREASKLAAIEGLTTTPIERLPAIADSEPGVEVLAHGLVREARMHTLLISGGRKDKIRPGDILGALTGEAGGLSGADIGKIEIHDRLSYVAVARGVRQRAVQSLNKGRIKGKRFRATLVP